MKRLIVGIWILLGALAVWAVQPAVAQGSDKGGKSDAVAKWLQLSDEQKAKIKSIWENARQQAQKIRGDTTLQPKEKHTRLRELWRQTRQEIGSVLAPEQRTKWHRWQMAKAYRAGKIAKALGLSKAQERELARIHQRAQEARRHIWSAPSLSPAQKWQRLRELRRKEWEELRQQLTPEQERKLRAFVEAGKRRWWQRWSRR
ncbi:MAG: hypothetical protein C4335_08550 [Armatimonadota bacterium]